MTVTIKVKAAEGRKVIDPRTFKRIPSDRAVSVPKTCFWIRRLQAGDVIEVAEQKAAKPKKTTVKPKPVEDKQ